MQLDWYVYEDDLVRRVIVFAVTHARARAHALHLAGIDHVAVAHAVFVFETAAQDVGDDLHVAVAVGGKAAPRLHAILVDDAQRAEAHEARVVVVAE